MLFLKEHKEVALHVACGDITDVQIKDGTLTLLATDKTMLALLENGKREIERALSWQGLDLSINIVEKAKEVSKVEEDINKLSKIVGNKLKMKN